MSQCHFILHRHVLFLQVISIEYPLQMRFSADALTELNSKFPEGQALSRAAFANRVNYKERETFILKSPIVKGQNMALSIELLQDNNLLLGVHTIDMTYFVKPESQLDNESHDRAMTVTVDDQPVVSMLPERMRNELCAVRTNEEVITISVFLSVNQVGEVQKVQPARCVIQPKFELTYEDAEAIICGKAGQSPPHMIQILMLHRIAQMWRKKRLGITAAYEEPCTTLKTTPNAYQLMEEVTATVNCIVAQVLLEKYPDQTPLIRQLKPCEAALNDWKDLHTQTARNSVALLWPFMDKGSNENAMFPITRDDQSETVTLTHALWERLIAAIDEGHVDEIQQIVATPDHVPLQGIAKLQLDELTETPRYVCSSETDADRYCKFLAMPIYIRFTMPLHNYIDIVVQRLLTTVIDNKKTPYSTAQIEDYTNHQTKAMLRAQRYGKALQAKDILAYLQCKPLTTHPYVQSLDGYAMRFRYPVLSDMLTDFGELVIGHLGVTQDVTLDASGSVQLLWQQRIYDANEEKHTATSDDDIAQLNPNR